jgi:hypothetical protein
VTPFHERARQLKARRIGLAGGQPNGLLQVHNGGVGLILQFEQTKEVWPAEVFFVPRDGV